MNEPNFTSRPFSLTSSQHWMIEELKVFSRYWNIAFLLETPHPLEVSLLEQAIFYLLKYHDALRLRLIGEEQMLQARIVDPDQFAPLLRIDVSELSNTEQENLIQATAYDLTYELSQLKGQLLRYVYFDFGTSRPGHLLWVISHFITDAFSCHILLQDLQHVYGQMHQGKSIRLPPKTASFQAWAERQAQYVQSQELKEELETYWLKLPWHKVRPLPLDHPDRWALNTVASSRNVSASLSVNETNTLKKRLAPFKVQMLDLLLAALAQAFASWTKSPILHVCVIANGRLGPFDDISLHRTVGFIALGRRMLLDIEKTSSILEALSVVTEQIHAAPCQGIGLDCLTFASRDKQVLMGLQNIPRCEVEFNYTGWMNPHAPGQTWFQPVRKDILMAQNSQALRRRIFYLSAGISNGQLWLDCQYSENIHERVTVEVLTRNFLQALRDFLSY